jgi:hypothetical protein
VWPRKEGLLGDEWPSDPVRSEQTVSRFGELVPMRRIAYVVNDESFGMRRMFEHYGFANLEPLAPGYDSSHS